MKVCPKCEQTFNDDNLMFCLLDGSPLALLESQPTVVIPQTVAPTAKNSTMLWVALLVLLILFVGGAFVGLLIYYYRSQGENAGVNNSNLANTKLPPKPTATPKPVSSPTPAAPSPVSAETNTATKNDETDEITPIAWNTAAVTFKTDVGRTYKFQCPENGAAGSIWGSDIYTADSSICTAAVHAGIITLDRGGVVTIEFRPGRSVYGSTVRNGITSNTYGEYPHSFVVR